MSGRHSSHLLIGLLAAGCFESIVRTADDAGLTCSEGLTLCGDVCVDVGRDRSHCGACDTPCSPGFACATGSCLPVDCSGADCSEDQVCEQGRCLGIDCVGVFCGAGACYRGACLPETCATHGCSPGQVCEQDVCLDPRCVGVGCTSGLSCVGGTCVIGCVSGSTCSPDAECRLGQTTCVDGGLGCADVGAVTPGTSCDGGVCSPSGACGACDAGDRCAPAACFIGAVSCSTGLPACVATGQLVAGSECGTGRVCSADGGCFSCDAGVACAPGNQCLVGLTSCGTGALACVPSGPAASGALCGTNQVCDGDGGCVACVAGSTCTPQDAPCFDGVLSCIAGVTCNRSARHDAGSSCGTGKVCAPDAGCIDCVPGAPCDAGTCLDGVLACGSGTPRCAFTGYTASGTTCGSGQFCNGDGGCGACSPGGACSTGNVCEFGVITCGSGSPVCVGQGAKPPGVICRTAVDACDVQEQCAGLVCPSDLKAPLGATCGSSNAAACDAQDSCNGAGACVNRVKGNGVSCRAAAGECDLAETCDGLSDSCPGDAHRLAGASCTGGVCDGNLTCNACSLGAACGSNPNSCFDGVIQCGTGVAVCADNLASPRLPGAACVGGVCNGAGVCTPCVAGSACTTNPSACFNGVIVCGSGAPVCTNNAASPKLAGTSCGSSSVAACDAQDTCDGAGTCVNRLKASGVSCRAAATECDLAENCDGASASCPADARRPAGSACTGGVCDGNLTCNACLAGTVCTTNPNRCFNGVVQCGTGVAVCADNLASPLAPGTACAGGVCNGSGACTPCTAGAACTTNPNTCFNGVVACGTGAPVCTDNLASPKAPGATCPGGVCNGSGACTPCVAGAVCTTNPNACRNGAVVCASGAPVCTDNAASPKVAGTTCGSSTATDCDAQDTCDGAGACVNRVKAAAVVCRSAGASATCNPSEACDGVSAACPLDVLAPPGTSCGSSSSSGCDAQDTCDAAGNCVDRVKSAGVICLAAGADATCDPAEVCNGSTAACPANAFASLGTSCGSSNATDCDAQDTCSGAGACVNRVKAGGVSCRAAAAECDLAESCDGASAACPADLRKSAGTTCTGGVCDGNLTCNACVAGSACTTNPSACFNGVVQCGTGVAVCADNLASPKAPGTTCPGGVCNGSGACTPCVAGAVCTTNPSACFNGVVACGSGAPVCNDNASSPKVAGTACGSSTSSGCDAQDTCDGAGTCVNRVKGAGAVCFAAGADPTCDPAEVCDGATAICPPNAFAPAGTSCGSPSTVACDDADSCNGLGACVDRVKGAGVICRPAADPICDLPESCTGSAATCPADVLAVNGTVCEAETCDFTVCQANCGAEPLCNSKMCTNGACLLGVPRVLAGGCAARPCSRPPSPDGFCCNAACSDTGC